MIYTYREEEFELTMMGTVGITLIADALMNGEPTMVDTTTEVDGKEVTRSVPTKRYQLALLYAVLMACHKGIEEKISFYEFGLSLSFKKYNELSTWFWTRWNEIEGIMAEEPKKEEGKKKVKS